MAKNNIRTYQIGKTTVQINRSRCNSCGTCTIVAPEIFELDEYLISRVKQTLKNVNKRDLKETENQCSYKAIKIIKKSI